jgi:hypothetical protein
MYTTPYITSASRSGIQLVSVVIYGGRVHRKRVGMDLAVLGKTYELEGMFFAR